MEGGSTIPAFGDWNKNPSQADGYIHVFNQLSRVRKMPDHNTINTSPNPSRSFKQTKLSQIPKFGSTDESKLPDLNTKEEFITSPYVPEMNRDPGSSLVTKKDSKRADDSHHNHGGDSINSADSHAVVVSSATGVPIEQSHLHPMLPSSISRPIVRPAPNWAHSGVENTEYKAMDKLKQRICDVVSHKKNVLVLQAKIHALMEEVAQIQTLLMTTEINSRDEVHNWFARADEILKETDGILEGKNSMADKKRMCGTCLDPTSSWEIGQLLRDVDKILEERKGLNLSSYLCGFLYCKKLKSKERMLQEILEAVMDIHVDMISICGMIGVGKTILAKELARHAHNDQLFDVIVMVQVSDSVDVKLVQSKVSNKIGLQLSDDDDEETRARILYSALEKKTTERGQENDPEPAQQSKILVILDGLQSVIELEKVGIPYGHDGRASCKVVLISRSTDVCKKMGAEKLFLVECLDLEEAKILFQEMLGDRVESMETALGTENYQHVEKVLLRKCRGLPLMIDSLVCALRPMRPFKWESIADQLAMCTLVEVDEVKEVPRAILELCNNFIQTVEKQKFFSLCCLIQSGVDEPLEKLMRFGIGCGLFEADSLASAADQMNSWIHELKSLSLLLETENPEHVKMHGIIQDVVISTLSQGDNILPVLLDASTFWHAREPYENCFAISMLPNSNFKCLNDLELPKLEALLLQGEPSLRLPNEFFKGVQNLKILDISRINFVDFPLSIGALKNLVTLHLEFCDISCGAISTITDLQTLEVLSLRGSTVEPFPGEFFSLNLRVLDLTDCRICTLCVDVLAKLYRLRELYLNGNYTKWSTSLIQSPLEVLEVMIPGICQVPPGVLNFPNLRRFVVICSDASYHRPLEDLHSFSRVLLIHNYSDQQLEESGLIDLLPRTEFLHIKKTSGLWNGVGDLSTHGFLQLRKMHIESCGEMKCILDTLAQRDVFPELEILTLKQLFSLTSLCLCSWQPCFSFFPKLQELRLTDLPQLSPFVLPPELALKMRIMEVSGCSRLLWVFATSDTNVSSSVELRCMERLELKGLTSLLALDDLSEDSITRNEPGRPCRRVLFGKKIKLPFLKEMHLENLEEIEELCGFSQSEQGGAEIMLPLQSPTYGKSSSFGNLTYLRVHACGKLKSLFPSKICKSLSQLEKLEVDDCHNLREVITSTDVEDDVSPTTTMISFPKLQTLRLKHLDRLQFFYQGSLELKLPLLRELVLHNLRGMKAFTLQNTSALDTQGTPLFDGKTDFASLKDLQVSCMDTELIKKHGDTTTFPNLQRLTLRELRYLKSLPNISSKPLRLLDLHKVECFNVLFSNQSTYILPTLPLRMSCELEELILSECNSMKELVANEKSDDNHKQLSCLKKLELRSSEQLKRIPWNELINIRSLVIEGLKGWTSLVSTSLLVGGNLLPLLESMKVEDCESLETIISREELQEEGEQLLVKYGITLFPCLRKIELGRLPKLETFSKGSYEVHFPSLETLEISSCPTLASFSSGPLRTPRLNSVILDSRTIKTDTLADPYAINSVILDSRTSKADTFENLNATKQGLHRGKVRPVAARMVQTSPSEFRATVERLTGTGLEAAPDSAL